MTRKAIILAWGMALTVACPAFGFQSDGASLTRSFSRTAALTNSQIVVTVNFTNDPTGVCHGFFYSDQLPSGLTVSTLSVTVNGKAVTNYLFESELNGDVYPGCTPYRWILEQPTNFAEANALPPRKAAQIVYAITSSVSNSFNLQQFDSAGFDAAATDSSFGYSETSDQQIVLFTTAGGISLSGQSSTNGFILFLNGLPGTNYVIDASTNFSAWLPLVTNASPFQFTDTNQAGIRYRFYRGRPF